MKPACPVQRLLIALLTVAVFSPMNSAAAERQPHDVEQRADWVYYVASCNQLGRQIATIQNGHTRDAQEASNKLRAILQTMQSHLAGTTPHVIDPQQLAQCQAITTDAQTDVDQQKQQDQITYQNSPEYKRARALGYRDVAGISFLQLYQDMDDEALMEFLMIIVDDECGCYFRATQYVKPYGIYTADAESCRCGERKRGTALRKGGGGVGGAGGEDAKAYV